MKEDWTDKLERKLEGFSMEEPDGLWSAIRSSLPEPAPAPVKSGVWGNVLTFVLPLAAAACITAMLVLPPQGLTTSPEPVQLAAADLDIVPVKEGEGAIDLLADAEPLPAEAHPFLSRRSASPAVDAVQLAEDGAADVIDVEEHEQYHEEAVPAVADVDDEDVHTVISQPVTSSFDEWPYVKEVDVRTKRPASISISAGNGSGHVNMDAAVVSADATPLRFEPMMAAEPVTPKHLLSDYDWDMSFRLNLLAEKYLSERLSVSSGLSWTMLDGKMSYGLGDARAHYVGVPVVIGYDLVHGYGFSIGATAGATASLGLVSPKELSVKGVQLSTNIGATARYSLSRHLALQLGLSADTYFPGKGERMGIFSERTTLMGANLGLVWSMQ